MTATNLIDRVQEESERFLAEELKAKKFRRLDFVQFMAIKPELRGNVGIRTFEVDGTFFMQKYLELNGEFVYLTTAAGQYEN